jgi:hypothetical protein
MDEQFGGSSGHRRRGRGVRSAAAAGLDDLAGAGVGGGEGGVVGLELGDEAVEEVLEVGVGAGDFGLDGLGDGGAAGNGAAGCRRWRCMR